MGFEVQINARGRLVTEEEFGEIIIKRGGREKQFCCAMWPD